MFGRLADWLAAYIGLFFAVAFALMLNVGAAYAALPIPSQLSPHAYALQQMTAAPDVPRGPQPIHYFVDQLDPDPPPGAPAYRMVWRECDALRTAAEMRDTPNRIRNADAAHGVQIAGCAALAELRCAVAGPGGVRERVVPGLHLVHAPGAGFRLMSAGHVLTFNFAPAREAGDFAFERNCLLFAGDGVALTGVRLMAPRFLDAEITAGTMERGALDFWGADPHVAADLAYFPLNFDAGPQGARARALVNAVALRTFSGAASSLAPFAQRAVCTFGTGFNGGFEARVRLAGCIGAGGVEMNAARQAPGQCRFRAPTTAYFSGNPLMGLDENGPVALCVISSEQGSEPSAPMVAGVPVISRDRARRYAPDLANNGVIYPQR